VNNRNYKVCNVTMKRGYDTEVKARLAIGRLLAAGDNEKKEKAFALSPYLCNACKLWHFGHKQSVVKAMQKQPVVETKPRHAYQMMKEGMLK
jgi:hypothetical protein